MSSHNGILQKDIEEALELICASSVFAPAPRMQQLLRFLVNETLQGRAYQLKAYTIALAVFGRDEHFNPQLDPVVRVEMRRLRGKLKEFYSRSEPLKIMIIIPKGGYIPEFMSGNSPGGADFQDQSSQIMHFARRNAKTFVIVIPFEDLSPERDKDFFAASVTSDITVALAKLPGISVAGYGYARQMLLSGCKIRDFVRQTKAKFVVSGNIRIQNGTIRLTVELTDAFNGALLCAQSFDYAYDAKKILSSQNILCQKALRCLAEHLHIASGFLENASARVALAKVENHEAILQYTAWEATLDHADFYKARDALEEVVDEKDVNPQTAAMLADIYASEYRHAIDQTPQALEKSLVLAEMALAKEPDAPIARLAQALYYFLQHDRKRLRQSLDKAINIRPNYNTVLASASILLLNSGEEGKARDIVAKVAPYREFMPWWHYVPLFILNYNAGDYKQALSCALHMGSNNFFYAPFLSTVAYAKLNMRKEAEQSLGRLQTEYPDLSATGRRLLQGMFFYEQAVDQFASILEDVGLRLS